MAWNVGLYAIKGDENTLHELLDNELDVLYLSQEDSIWFEEATSYSMESAIGITVHKNWILIADNLGRFFTDDTLIKQLSRKYECRIYWISEGLISRQYVNGILINQIQGISNAEQYLLANKVNPINEWGETIILQMIAFDLFNIKVDSFDDYDELVNLKMKKYNVV
jgi:hypothetical protein